MRALLALALLVGCNPPQEPAPPPGQLEATGEVVVTIDDKTVTEDMVAAVTRRLPDGTVEEMKEKGQYDQLLERIAIGQVLYQRALEKKLHEDPEVQAAIAMSAREVMATELLEQVAQESVTDEAVQKYYDEHQVQYAKPQVHARHILVKEENLANELKKQIDEGADFQALATQHSVDPGSGKEGGDLGWFEKRRMVPEFAEAAFAAEPGQVVGPVKSRFGFHVIQVVDKREKTPLEDVRPQIEEQLKQKAVSEYVEQLEKDVKIEVKGAEAPEAGAEEKAGDGDAAAHGPGDGHNH